VRTTSVTVAPDREQQQTPATQWHTSAPDNTCGASPNERGQTGCNARAFREPLAHTGHLSKW